MTSVESGVLVASEPAMTETNAYEPTLAVSGVRKQVCLSAPLLNRRTTDGGDSSSLNSAPDRLGDLEGSPGQ